MSIYQVICPNCRQEHPVEITNRQRHEEDFDVSLEYANEKAKLQTSDDVIKVAIAMYEQKCLDARSKRINENNLKLEEIRQENKRKNMRTMRGQ